MNLDQRFRTNKHTFSLSKQTVDNVDEFLKSELRRWETGRERKPSPSFHAENKNHSPKFVVDGYGRWREIGNEQNDQSIYEDLLRGGKGDINKFTNSNGRNMERESAEGSMNGRLLTGRHKEASVSKTSDQNKYLISSRENARSCSNASRNSTPAASYKHLSASLRSNIFPGLGKEKWESSTKTTYVPKRTMSAWTGPEYDFGVRKDWFMDWAEQDVYRMRLMKAWDKHRLDAMQERSAEKPFRKKATPKEKPKPEPVKKNKTKTKTPKEDSQEPKPKSETISNDYQATRIEVKPAPDDEFWNFYEKPFEQS